MYDTVNHYLSQQVVLPGYLITGQGELPATNLKVRYEKLNVGFSVQLKDYTNQNHPELMAEVTGIQFKAFFDVLELAYVADHRKIKANDDWKAFYGYFDYYFPYYDDRQNSFRTQIDKAVYCRQCGLLLHSRQVQVDHFKPQTGGRTYAVLKFFRALGLTLSGPTGVKGGQGRSQFAVRVGGSTATEAKLIRDVEAKNRCNQVGVIYYSAIRAANLATTLEDRCMNSYFNLRPVCGSCNAAKGNRMWED